MQTIKTLVWCILLSGFLFGIPERFTALFSDGWLSAPDLTQLFTASFFMVCVVILIPFSLGDDNGSN